MNNLELLKYIRLFRKKANTDKLIVFVGAGVSCNVSNMPSWSALIQKMAESIKYSKCDNCRKKDNHCHETCKFIDTFSPDEFLKIPQYVYNKNKKQYQQIVKDNIQHDPTINAPLSNAIIDLVPAHIITTNYDKLLENCKSMQKDNYEVIIHDKDLLSAEKNKYIIKMHGDIDHPETIVLKEADYLEYTQKHVLIEMFIKSLLADHTILFLGYSLNDYNVKLIISWINYIRSQNKALDKNTKFAYMVLDERKIAKNQLQYFESNNIGVINLNKMPLIKSIPSDLTEDIGKRLYSFLRTIEDPSLEKIFGTSILFKEAIPFIKQYKFVSSKNLCNLLFIKQYHIDGYELFIHLDSEYDRIIEFLKSENEDSKFLQQAFFDAGIYYVRLISSYTNRRDDYKICATQLSLLEDKFYTKYLINDYSELSVLTAINATEHPFKSCFYLSIIRDYTESVFKWHNSIEYDTLTTDDKVRFLFNESVLETRKTYRNNNQKITKYINALADVREKNMFSLYLDLFEGNNKKLQTMETSLNKLKEQYDNPNQTFMGCSSLSELFKIRSIAIEQYLFYFSNSVFFKGYSDLKKILKYYIEAIACTHGNFIEESVSSFGFRSVKERYAIDAMDFDILTKYVSIKELYEVINEYSVEKFNLSENMVDHAITCFDNLANYIIHNKIFHRFYDAPNNLINCAVLLSLFPLNDSQKISIKDVLIKLFQNDDFIAFFFSTEFPQISQSTRALCNLLNIVPKHAELNIIDRILHSNDFQSYYINSNVRRVQEIITFFMDDVDSEITQEKIYSIIMSFEGKERISAIRLLYKHTGTSKHIDEYKEFLKSNFGLVDADDIFDFTFDEWLDITEENSKEILTKAVSIYNQQQSSKVHSYPDPLQHQLELIYILYITGKISHIDCLRDIVSCSDFLEFFLEPESFDYKKIDFSNYMWENIARRQRFMDIILQHKSDILPLLSKKVESGHATEFERKILYGYFLDKSELL